MLGQESKKPQEGGAREERKWEDLYQGLNPASPISLVIKSNQPPGNITFVANDWDNRLRTIMSEMSIHSFALTPNDKPPPIFASDKLDSFVFRPHYEYIRNYGTSQALTDGTSGSFERESSRRLATKYDMDEHDFFWLKMVNQERLTKGLKPISENTFELLIEFFERSWFEYSRPSQRWNSRKLESKCAEDLRCDICGIGDTAAVNNLIVICEFCDLAVHQECYGVPLIPEGPWLCRKCYLVGSKAIDCALCPWKSGALKPTTDTNRPWCHVICALSLENEVRFLNPTLREPIEISGVHFERWNLVCNLCKTKIGAPVQCSIKTCHAAMHPKCARSVGCAYDTATCSFKCWRHSNADAMDMLPMLVSDLHDRMLKADGKEGTKLFHEPTLPQITLNAAWAVIQDLPDRMKTVVIETVAKYWSLKRARRHGVPLIRSFQIEPWTSGGILSDVNLSLRMRRALLKELGKLENVSALLYQLERRRLGSLLFLDDIIRLACHPFQTVLLVICGFLRKLDVHGFFASPVDSNLVPDYYDVIKTPMDLQTLVRKALASDYPDFESFYKDVSLIAHNAMTYNAPETVYFADATKFKEQAVPLLMLARRLLSKARILRPTDVWIPALHRLGDENNASQEKYKRELENTRNSTSRPSEAAILWAKKDNIGYIPARAINVPGLVPSERQAIPKRVLQAATKSPQRKILVQFFDRDREYGIVEAKDTFCSRTNLFSDDYKLLATRERNKKGTKISKQALRRAYKEALASSMRHR